MAAVWVPRYLNDLVDVALITPTDGYVLTWDAASSSWKPKASTGGGGGGGTVTAVSVATANGLAGSSSGGTTPALTLSTTVTGILKGSAGAIVAAAAGTDYLTPTGNGSGLTGLTTSQLGSAPSGLLKGVGGSIVAASAGVDYLAVAGNGSQLTGITVGQVSGAVSTSGSYANPSWITSLDGSKLSGTDCSWDATNKSFLARSVRIGLIGANASYPGIWLNDTGSPTYNNYAFLYDGFNGGGSIINGPAWINIRVGNTTLYTIDATNQLVGSGAGLTGMSKSQVGLANVENTALSTWAGSTNLITVGTIATGVWHGTAIADTYIASAATWNAKAPLASPTFTGTVTLPTTNVGGTLTINNAPVVRPPVTLTPVAGAATLDCNAGDMFTIALAAATALTISNMAAGMTIRLRVRGNGYALTYAGATITWAGGSAPALTGGTKADWLILIGTGSGTCDGGVGLANL